jgi:Pyruvate/2-oxoacid:ferredoxin oxidoreductase delta subunit
MAHHHTIKANVYRNLANRLNKSPQGAPPTQLLFEILKIMFSEREADLVTLLPLKPFTDQKAASIWKLDLSEAHKILNDLADRGILLDYETENGITYVLPPPMAGFFEFSLMRYRNDINQKTLAELFYQYLNVEEDFISDLFLTGETQLGRVFVNETALSDDNSLHVLDYERASDVIKNSSTIGIGVCYCRHKMGHIGKNCAAPMEICMTFNTCADSLIRHGIAKKVDSSEGMDILQLAIEKNLVQFGENVREYVGFICNCCGCCCEALIAARKFAFLHPVHTTNFAPVVNENNCTGCGKCVSLCPVEAMILVSANDPHKPLKKKAKLDFERCLGCGVCLRGCNENALFLKSREKRVITPVNTVHRMAMMAIERGKFQNFLFDNQVLFSHRAMAAILGVILKLPPVKQLMAREQFKSRYLESLIRKNQKAKTNL